MRKHLGAEKISLWGISYGSHLALAAMTAIPDEIDKVVIAIVEGLDQTAKLPSRTDTYFEQLAPFVYPDQPIVLRAMPTAMDRASGITQSRLARVEKEAESSLLGAYLNFPMPQAFTELEYIDLGDEFRTGPESAIPTLVLTGSVDGRTYPASQRKATRGLTNATHITVNGAGHNLFMASPAVGEVMGEFFSGRPVTMATIEILDP